MASFQFWGISSVAKDKFRRAARDSEISGAAFSCSKLSFSLTARLEAESIRGRFVLHVPADSSFLLPVGDVSGSKLCLG